VECIDIVEHMPFNIGNAMKYLWRAGLKAPLDEDLAKAIWYIQRERDRALLMGRQAAAEAQKAQDAILQRVVQTPPRFTEPRYAPPAVEPAPRPVGTGDGDRPSTAPTAGISSGAIGPK
jgi:hypothetical protein